MLMVTDINDKDWSGYKQVSYKTALLANCDLDLDLNFRARVWKRLRDALLARVRILILNIDKNTYYLRFV